MLVLAVAAPAFADATVAMWPALLRRDLVRLASIEWRLRSAAGNTCPAQVSDVGAVFDDRRTYAARDWPLIESALGLKDRPVVAGVVPDGPADRADLRAGDEIVLIGGETVDAIVARRNPGALVPDALLAEIGDATPGAILEIVVRRQGSPLSLQVQPVAHCSVRMVLFTSKKTDAHSDNRNVAISTGMVTFARTDDELALAAGHELAHVIAGDRAGSSMSVRRRMEEAADKLGLRLMECAGYDREKGFSLFQRMGKSDWLGFLRAPTHRSWAARIATLRTEPSNPICPVAIK